MSNTAPHYTGKDWRRSPWTLNRIVICIFAVLPVRRIIMVYGLRETTKSLRNSLKMCKHTFGGRTMEFCREASYSKSLQSARRMERDHRWNIARMSPIGGKAFLPYFANLRTADSNSSDTVVKLIGDGEIKRAKKSYTTDYYLMSQTEQKSYISSIDDRVCTKTIRFG